ncbi:MAG: hypothetical protein IPJ30_09035 [Acidobacteria bacterium]|nr:hypothetical protein [Acidobacteriota bacterium]
MTIAIAVFLLFAAGSDAAASRLNAGDVKQEGSLLTAFLANNDFEANPGGTQHPNITAWSKDYYAHNDCGTRGDTPYGSHQLLVSDTRYFTGTKSIYSFSQNAGGGGGCNADPNSRNTTVDLTTTAVFSTNANTLYLWRSEIDYSTSSRWNHNLTVVISDGVNTEWDLLFCRAWGLQEGCTNNFQDTHDLTAIGADGLTWYRHPIPIPPMMNKDNLRLTIRHDQDSWDGTSAWSSLYYDLVGEIEPECQPLPNNAVSWWRAEGNAEDSIGQNDGSFQGDATTAAGKVGRAFSLDGQGDYVQVLNPQGLPVGNSSRTVELWFKTPVDLSSATESGIIQYGSASNGNMFGLITSANAPGKLYFYGHNADLGGTTTLLPNSWYHGAVTYDGTTVRLYVNGNLENTAAMGLNTVLDPNGLTIGYRVGGPFWNGQLDDPTIYDRALTLGEIQSIYNAGSGGKCIPCRQMPNETVAWWPADGNTADIAGTQSNDGLMNGDATYAPGKSELAFSFDGNGDFIRVSDATDIRLPSTGFAIGLWFRTYAVGSSQMILSKGVSDENEEFSINLTAERSIYWDYGGLTSYVTTTPLPIATGNWYYLTVVYDPSASVKGKVYLNGIEQPLSATATGDHIVNSGSDLYIGTQNGGSPYYLNRVSFNGLIDEVGFVGRVLTASEILSIYEAGSSGICRSCSLPPSGLIGWWPGDANTFDIVNGNNGTLQNGATYAAGRVGLSFTFDGSNDYVEIPHRTDQNTGDRITVAAWVKQASPVVGASIIQKRSAPNVGGFTLETLGTDASAIQFYLMIGGNWYPAFTPSGVLQPGVWHHVVGTYDGASMKVYVDGAERVSVPQTGSIDPTNDPLVIGRNVANLAPWHGEIDEVQLLNRALSATEIRQLSNAGRGGNCKPRAFVPNSGSETVSVIDIAANKVSATVAIGGTKPSAGFRYGKQRRFAGLCYP